MRFLTLSLGMISLASLVGCASGNCETMQNKNVTPEVEMAMEKKLNQQLAQKVRVYKYDGTKQCGEGKEITLAEMAKQLNGIVIFSSQKLSDGKMRIQMCGADTGMANVYEIDRSDLPKAVTLGFQEWTFQ